MTLQTPVNVPGEVALTGAADYTGTGHLLDLDAVVTAADGQRWVVPAFWAGGSAFRFRFAPPAAGRYTWESRCQEPRDAGLHQRRGVIEGVPYNGPSELYRRGRPRLAADQRSLTYGDGTPFLWCADTWWFALVKRLKWPQEFQELARDRIAKGFNVIQIVAGPLPDFDAIHNPFDPQQENENGLPWERGWQRLNPAFFDLADQRLAWLVEHDLLPCIVGLWGYFLPYLGVPNVRRHWRYLIARYGAYPVVWTIAGETLMPTYSLLNVRTRCQAEAAVLKEHWSEVAAEVRQLDPWHSLITTHPNAPSHARAQFTSEALVDLNMLQTSHGSRGVVASLELLRSCLALTPAMPTFIAEGCYEGVMGSSLADVQRALFWGALTMGACGHTYGAQGIWGMNSRDYPHVGDTGCWGTGYWQDAMHWPGSAQVGLGAQLLRRWPWHRCRPDPLPPELMGHRLASFSMSVPGAIRIVYVPSNAAESILRGLLSDDWNAVDFTVDARGLTRATYYDPATGEPATSVTVTPAADGSLRVPRKPSFSDWVLVLDCP